MTETTTTTTPPEGLTDKQLDALERQHWKVESNVEYEPGAGLTETLDRHETFQHRAYARAAIAADRADRPAPAPVPVAVAERPWEREGWCDAEGRCWWGRCADDFFSPEWTFATHPEWTFATHADIEEFCSDAMPQISLPHWAIPQPPQGGEVAE